FAEEISKVYARLDYIHPFCEGNSRTLREFTRQIAQANGYKLSWEKFNESDKSRDLLCIARDRAVGEHAVQKIRSADMLRLVVYSMDRFEQNPSLGQLVKGVVRPTRAIAFAQLPENEAVKAHPELAETFKALRAAETYFSQKPPGNPAAQRQAMEETRRFVLEHLDAGETRRFQRPQSRLPEPGDRDR
ncbi:MAG: Fic family protein, partial [Betaproteobacteria bacterium]|nr:Fic family protein [Betaproteobacteria bacterium]